MRKQCGENGDEQSEDVRQEPDQDEQVLFITR